MSVWGLRSLRFNIINFKNYGFNLSQGRNFFFFFENPQGRNLIGVFYLIFLFFIFYFP